MFYYVFIMLCVDYKIKNWKDLFFNKLYFEILVIIYNFRLTKDFIAYSILHLYKYYLHNNLLFNICCYYPHWIVLSDIASFKYQYHTLKLVATETSIIVTGNVIVIFHKSVLFESLHTVTDFSYLMDTQFYLLQLQ